MNVPSYEQLLAENERLREEGRKDYEGMREFQQKYIAADQELRKLRAELEKAKSVPMKYRRMEFNAQLQNENTRLRAELDALKQDVEKQEPAGEVVLFGERLKEISWRKGKLPDVGTKLYARPVPAPSVPGGWQLVPKEVADLYGFMCSAFVPMTGQQEEIAKQLDLAKQAMKAEPKPEVK